VESQSAELGVNGVSGCEPVLRPKAEISQFIDDAEFIYQDFARRGETSLIPTFRVQVFWTAMVFGLRANVLSVNFWNVAGLFVGRPRVFAHQPVVQRRGQPDR
jgi:hypothetical protein